MKPMLFALNAAAGLAEALAAASGLEAGAFDTRHFPDGETYLRLLSPVVGRDVVFLCTLDNPDARTLPLLFAAAAAKEQGARSVGLIAPYLGYMRQDKAFQPGEAVTSVSYARLISDAVDWLVTVDPHLHRHPTLGAIYSVPSFAVTAAEPIAEWLRAHVPNPMLIGPDEESTQWVGRIAELAQARFTVLRKTRRGNRDVSIAAGDLDLAANETPVIIDDIASSARTMIEAVRMVHAASHRPPVCVAVHPVFAGDSFDRLQAEQPAEIVSSNTIAHPSNAIDVSGPIAAAIGSAMAAAASMGR